MASLYSLHLPDNTITINLEREDVSLLRALCQNLHPTYEAEPSTVEAAQKMFNFLRKVEEMVNIEPPTT